jgi:hypothetical protein
VSTLFEDDKTIDTNIDLLGVDIHIRITERLEKNAHGKVSIAAEDLADLVVSEMEIDDVDLVNFTKIEAINVLNKTKYALIPMEDKILLIPHCLRDAERCIAPIDEDGYHCQKCGACVIADITLSAEAKGLKWYMVGGGSHAIRIVKNVRPRAVLGIACYNDARMAFEKLSEYCIPAQGVLLSKDGCVNTEVYL